MVSTVPIYRGEGGGEEQKPVPIKNLTNLDQKN
jgi:hypothetical protein